jgi:predicted Zn-dependent peptidase
MMFQGSKHVAEDTFFKRIDAVGGYGINGTTSNDRTNYFESVPRHELPMVLWIEADRMGFLLDTLTEKSFRNQQEVVRNERRQRTEMAPYGNMYKALSEAMYPVGHPYHHQVIGTHEDLAAASVEDVRAFFRKWYTPANATIAIVGDIDVPETRAMVEKYFGAFKGPPAPTKLGPAEVTAPQKKRLEMEAKVQLPRLVYSWPTIRRYAPGDAELDLVAMVLGSGKASRLEKRLVHELKIAQHVSVDHDSAELVGEFSVEVDAKPGRSLDEIKKEIDEEIARVRKEGVSKEELDRARVKLEARAVMGLESNQGRASRLQSYNHYAGDPGFVEKDMRRYRAVTPEQMQKWAADKLDPGNAIYLTIQPNPAAPIGGRMVEPKKVSVNRAGKENAK